MDALVTTEWLERHRQADDVRVVDATLVAADTGRDARREYEAGHIPGAAFLDLAELRDRSARLPNMLPNPELFAEHAGALGLSNATRIVLYDASPWHSAARAWWLFRGFGARSVAILDGGLAKWRAEGRPLETGTPPHPQCRFDAHFDRASVRTLQGVLRDLDMAAILDARSAARFSGDEPDPHAGTAPGHIPGSASLPYTRLFNADGTWKRDEALAAEFAAAGIDWTRPVVTTCGSGITAAVLAFGAHLLGHATALYDGSWSEWGADPATPKALGPA